MTATTDLAHVLAALHEEYGKNCRALDDAMSIVRALAACDAPLDGEYGECGLCEGNRELVAARHGIMNDFPYGEPIGHDAACPWRLAREWVAANGDKAREDT